MHTLSANDLKVKGVAAIESALLKAPEVAVAVRGEKRFIVMAIEQYEHLRECELEAAWHEARNDITTGNVRSLSATAHKQEMDKRLALAVTAKSKSHSYLAQQDHANYLVTPTKTVTRKKTKLTTKLATARKPVAAKRTTRAKN